jgi:hypothetical protein
LESLANVARTGDGARILEILPHQLSEAPGSTAVAGDLALPVLQPVARLPLSLQHSATLAASADNASSPESSGGSSDQDRKPRAQSPPNA